MIRVISRIQSLLQRYLDMILKKSPSILHAAVSVRRFYASVLGLCGVTTVNTVRRLRRRIKEERLNNLIVRLYHLPFAFEIPVLTVIEQEGQPKILVGRDGNPQFDVL